MSSNSGNASKRRRDDGSPQDGGGSSGEMSKRAAREEQESSPPGDEAQSREGESEDEDANLTDKEKLERYDEMKRELKKLKRQRMNVSFKSLMEVKQGSFEVGAGASAFSNVDGRHIPASSEELNFPLCDPHPETIESMSGGSCLLNEFVDQDHLDGKDLKFFFKAYESEADICGFVAMALKDAIYLIETEMKLERGQLQTRLERSLFGSRPDIMVVRNKRGVGLVAIEVKRPPTGEIELIKYPKVVGHAYDHVEAMNAFGQGTAIVMITSFKESYLCSLNESDFLAGEQGQTKQAQAEQEDTSKLESSDVSQSVQQTQSPPRFKEPNLHGNNPSPSVSFDNSSSAPSSNSSPASSRSSVASSSAQRTDSEPKGNEVGSVFLQKAATEGRKLFATRAYHQHELVKLAYNAIKLALSKYVESTKEIHKLEPNKTYSFPKVLRVVAGGEENYCWGELRATLGRPITSRKPLPPIPRAASATQPIDGDDINSYYIIGSLGHGATSNVFQALDSEGKHVAIKVYVKNVDEKGIIMGDKVYQEKAREVTEKEASRLQRLYPFLVEEVKTTTVFDQPCVVMPFFEPVKKENREATLNDIATVLNDSFLPAGLKYVSDDVRWRHVGSFRDAQGEKHCVLYDVADLEEGPSESEDKEALVAEQIKIWKGRIEQEPQGEGTLYVNKD